MVAPRTMRLLFNLKHTGIWLAAAGLGLAQPQSLTLEQALERVERTSLTVLISRESIAQAFEQSVRSRSSLLPQVTFDATQRRSRSAAVGAAVVRAGISSRFDAQLNARLDLLNPENIATYQASRLAVAVAQLGEAQVRQSVMAAVAESYFAHLRNLERIAVLDDNVARARRLRDLAQHQLDAGVATQIDVTRADAQVAVAVQARLQQATVVQGSELQLKQLLDLDMQRPLALADFTVRRTEPGVFTPIETTQVYDRRPDMQSARRLLDQHELEVKAARYGRLPSLALIGSYGEATERVLDGGGATTWSSSIALSLPLFDGSRTKSLTNFALSRRRAQELRVRDLENQISAELQLARQDAASRYAQISVAETGLALAREEMELAQQRFAQGVADNREIIEAQGRLAEAGDNVVEAIYRYKVSRVELARVRGDVARVLADRAE